MLLGLRLLDTLAEDGCVLALLQPATLFLGQILASVQNLFELLDPQLGVLDLMATSNITPDDFIFAVLAHHVAAGMNSVLGYLETILLWTQTFFFRLLINVVIPSILQLLIELLGEQTGVIRLIRFLVIELSGQGQIGCIPLTLRSRRLLQMDGRKSALAEGLHRH